MNAVEVKGLSKSFGGFELKDISFALPAGCIMGIVGENGAGKTTTLKLLLGITDRDSGSVNILGGKTAPAEKIGVVFDECKFHESFTAYDVNRVLKSIYKSWEINRFFELLDKFEVPRNTRIRSLSRGMKMKLSIAAALSHNAQLLVLDEPTSALDPVVRDEILDMLYDFVSDERHSVIISSHIVSDLEKICDYIAFLHKGRLLLFEEKDELLNDCAAVQISNNELESIDKSGIIGVRKTDFGTTAILRKEAAAGFENKTPVNLEELFLYMVRGEDK